MSRGRYAHGGAKAVDPAAQQAAIDAALTQYQDLMKVIRWRLDQIHGLKAQAGDGFARAEMAAFHGRKIVEGIAFGSLVAVKNGLKYIPRDAEKQWNAENIFNSLDKKQMGAIPNPGVFRKPTPEEAAEADVAVVVDGQPALRLTKDQIVAIYQRLHKWLHEMNPYVFGDWDAYYTAHQAELWADLDRIENMIARHSILIGGHGFFCTLRDSVDGTTKALALSKV